MFLRYAESRGVRYGEDPAAFDPDFVARALPAFAALWGPGRWFDVHARGWEHVPDGAGLLVSNHSGGTLVPDAFGLGTAWYTTLGPTRPLHGLAHEMVFTTHTTGQFLQRCGAIRAGHAMAHRAMVEMGRQVVVMPGGDRDVWRPASRRYRVTFAGRLGYARMALRLGVPIIPVAHVGAHHTLHVLTDGRKFARRLGFRRLARAEIFPVHLSLPWGLAIGPWPHLPPPTRFDYRFGHPIDPVGDASNPSDVLALDGRVQFAMQDLLDDIREERRRVRLSPRERLRRAEEAVDSVQALVRFLRGEGFDDTLAEQLGRAAAK